MSGSRQLCFVAFCRVSIELQQAESVGMGCKLCRRGHVSLSENLASPSLGYPFQDAPWPLDPIRIMMLFNSYP